MPISINNTRSRSNAPLSSPSSDITSHILIQTEQGRLFDSSIRHNRIIHTSHYFSEYSLERSNKCSFRPLLYALLVILVTVSILAVWMGEVIYGSFPLVVKEGKLVNRKRGGVGLDEVGNESKEEEGDDDADDGEGGERENVVPMEITTDETNNTGIEEDNDDVLGYTHEYDGFVDDLTVEDNIHLIGGVDLHADTDITNDTLVADQNGYKSNSTISTYELSPLDHITSLNRINSTATNIATINSTITATSNLTIPSNSTLNTTAIVVQPNNDTTK